MISSERLSEIKAREKAVTVPRLRAHSTKRAGYDAWMLLAPPGWGGFPKGYKGELVLFDASNCKPFMEALASFLAHARQDVPDLVAEVERLGGQLADFRAALSYLAAFSCQGGRTADWCRHSGIEARLFCGPCRAKLALCGAP